LGVVLAADIVGRVSSWLAALLVAMALYALALGALVALGRREHAGAWLRLVPDCLVLARRLIGDPRVPRSRKLALGLLAAYLAMPFDLVPDFVPIAGALDDAVLAALVLRSVVRAAGTDVLREHWPGPATTLAVVQRLAGG
jgi:uncharacterized membrane protein YkvA (DUF1232 family)